ncbi:hypothetical protein [Sphingomonas sp. Leaf412]|nr:hypothetical protein [Sphingomonas sp. Leaf412]
MTKAHTQDLYGVAILLAIFLAALFLAKLFAGAVIGVGAMMLG